MQYKKYVAAILFIFLLVVTSYGQQVLKLNAYDGTEASYVNAQIKADTTATGGLLADRVYELQRDQIYLDNTQITVPNGKTLRLRAEEGTGKKPVIYLWESGTGTTPTRPPGNFVALNGGSLEISNICIAGYYEAEPSRVSGVQGGLINVTAAGSKIILDGVVLSNINGQHVRVGFNSPMVKITNSIFANMGALETSNLGAGKGIDLREIAVDSVILQNNTFVNFQDRAIRHYNVSKPNEGTGLLGYVLIDHNTFVNGMGFHGLFSLGNVGDKVTITNNVFMDAFALGEDPTDATRTAEWANTGEFYPDGKSRITWIFTAPNQTTQWTVKNNYFALSDSGKKFLNDFNFKVGSQLSWHINGRLGADSVNAFKQVNLALNNIPRLMTNEMRWYESPAGGNKSKNTPTDKFVFPRDDMDRRVIEFYRDTLSAAYATSSEVYTGADAGLPAGDLNWFPDKYAQWKNPTPAFSITVDGQKDDFYKTLTGPDNGFLQLRSFTGNDNGKPKNDSDLSAKVWAAWDKDWFYVYSEVQDNIVKVNDATNNWANDCIELKFDAQPTDSTKDSIWPVTLTALSRGFGGATTNAAADSMATVPDSLKKYSRNHLVPGGYILELALKWKAIGHINPERNESITPEAGTVFGLAVMFHDNDASGRKASIEWASVMRDAAWNTPKYLATAKLLADNKVQFIPQSTPTPWRINHLPYDGSDYVPSGVQQTSSLIPKEFSLSQNYPNPFNPTTTIRYALPKATNVTLTIYNALGQEVTRLVNQEQNAGTYSVAWDGKNASGSSLSSGVYFYQIRTDNIVLTKKMQLLK